MVEVSTEPIHIKTSEIIASKGEAPWYERLFVDGRNAAGLICDPPEKTGRACSPPSCWAYWA